MTLVELPVRNRSASSRSLRLPRPVERLAGVLVLLLVWQGASSAGLLGQRVLAGPISVGQGAWQLAMAGTLESAIWASLQRVLLGLVIGVPLGTLLGLVSGMTRLGEDFVDTPMQMLRFVPVVGLQPLVVLWFGIGNVAKVSLIVFGVIFPLYINLFQAVRAVDPRYHELANVVGLKRLRTVARVVLPGALPGFMSGLRISVAVAWLVLVFAEQINASNGIGYLIVNAESFFQTNVIVVGLAVYAILGLVSDLVVRGLERSLLAWEPSR